MRDFFKGAARAYVAAIDISWLLFFGIAATVTVLWLADQAIGALVWAF